MKLQLTSIAKDINAMTNIQVEAQRAAALVKKQSKTNKVSDQEEAERIRKKRKRDLWLKNERKKKLAEKYAITKDGDYYIYKDFKYENLQDAINFAKLQTT